MVSEKKEPVELGQKDPVKQQHNQPKPPPTMATMTRATTTTSPERPTTTTSPERPTTAKSRAARCVRSPGVRALENDLVPGSLGLPRRTSNVGVPFMPGGHRMAPQPAAEERLAARRQLAQDEALFLAAKASKDFDEIVVFDGELLDVPASELMRRLRIALRNAARHDEGEAYVGSTSDPKWRWTGGTTLTEEGRHHMSGHCKKWQHLQVLGAWPDTRCATMEVAAIAEARAMEQDVQLQLAIANKADDARGLRDRGCHYSFVYVCW